MFNEGKGVLQSRPPGVFGFGAPAWNDSRCPEQAGEAVHAAMVPRVFALKLYSYGLEVHTRFLVVIRDTSHSSSFPEHSFHLTFEKNIHFTLDPVSPSHQTYPQPPHHLSPPPPPPSLRRSQYSSLTSNQPQPHPKFKPNPDYSEQPTPSRSQVLRPTPERAPFSSFKVPKKKRPPTYLPTYSKVPWSLRYYLSITIHPYITMHDCAEGARAKTTTTQPNPARTENLGVQGRGLVYVGMDTQGNDISHVFLKKRKRKEKKRKGPLILFLKGVPYSFSARAKPQ